jgi:hypothetical protein
MREIDKSEVGARPSGGQQCCNTARSTDKKPESVDLRNSKGPGFYPKLIGFFAK